MSALGLRARPRARGWCARGRGAIAAGVLALGCAGARRASLPASDGAGDAAAPGPAVACPATAPAPAPLPGVRPEHRTLAYWSEVLGARLPLDEVLLESSEVADHMRALALPREGGPLAPLDLDAPLEPAAVWADVVERMEAVANRIARGEYVDERGGALGGDVREALRVPSSAPVWTPTTHLALGHVQILCAPVEARFYTPALDLRFNRNNCSSAAPQEWIERLARWSDRLWLVRTATTLGWIAADAPLSPPLTEAERAVLAAAPGRAVRGAASVRVDGDLEVALPPHGRVHGVTGDPAAVLLATGSGLRRGTMPLAAPSDVLPRPMTRRAVLEEAFALLDTPYGWGGEGGGRDCSQFVHDVLARVGLGLPRHSARQALAGSFSVDVSAVASVAEKERILDAAEARGVVLLHFPGHVMLYLGRDRAGTPMVIHSFAEYLEPCPVVEGAERGGETLRLVDRVTVSGLGLGAGTSRRSFLERITRITVFGGPAGPALAGAAEPRAAAPVELPAREACRDSVSRAIFRSPRDPSAGRPMRVIATGNEDPGPVALTLFDPAGAPVRPAMRTLGGPPYTQWVELAAPGAGVWTAVLGDGSRVLACERFSVARGAPMSEPVPATAWTSRWKWEWDTENLYAAFVEQLFAYPVEEELTWPSLQTLLLDRDHNLLFDYLGQGEDRALALEPDCADLPYFLRAYFAWKLRLPFAFRRCSRGRQGEAPACGAPTTNAAPRAGESDAEAFRAFLRDVANGVHSATARTLPTDEETDLYPVALTREALRPGTVFADPHGHLIVVARWVPQGASYYGVLLGADAQPDGTVGRRRFWRGTFLFSPETTDVGAGFKAWRPVVFDAERGVDEPLDNAALAGTEAHVPLSLAQYQGTEDAFYDRMEALMNPRPLDAEAALLSLVDALGESVARRVVSVENGERYVAARPGAPVAMPLEYAIFETTGPWEDYATPSRDMRLLIAIDAVRGFGASVVRAPARFGLSVEEAERRRPELEARLATELEARRFSYRRSDGSEWTLSFAALMARGAALELAYNPNDCVEVRWGAAPGSAEAGTCGRRAPAEQRARMERYRPWFATRRRPPRGQATLP